MANAPKAAPAISPSTLLLAAALGKRQGNSDRFMDVVADETAGVVNGVTEVVARSFGGAGSVWDAGKAAGKLDGLGHAERMLQRVAARNGYTPQQAAELIAAIG